LRASEILLIQVLSAKKFCIAFAPTQRPRCCFSAVVGCGLGSISEQEMVRILLADNRLLIRAGLRALLETHSDFHICGEARSGQEAVDLACQKKPDIVVININIPIVNGIEATRRIRKESSGTEVLIYTKEDNGDLIREALCAGARGYLPKSASDDEILEAIDALGRHRAFYSSLLSEQFLRSVAIRVGDHGDGVRLTGREQEILRFIAEGRRSKHIAETLGISQKTVQTHRTAVMRKLQLQSVAAIVRYAVKEKLVHA
jgi:DNA-binding NarL/FixJ family response regulator